MCPIICDCTRCGKQDRSDSCRHLERRLPVSGLERGPACHPERSEGSFRPSSQTQSSRSEPALREKLEPEDLVRIHHWTIKWKERAGCILEELRLSLSGCVL